MLSKESGQGLPLPAVYDAVFGTSKSAKAFRTLIKDAADNTWDDAKAATLLPLAAVAANAISDSHEFRRLWGTNGEWGDARDTKAFILSNHWYFPSVKRWFEEELRKPRGRLSKETSQWLKNWVNTNGGRLPKPDKETVHELMPYRPTGTRIYYRGYRFNDVGELVAFHTKYGKGKAFPFVSDRFSPWTSDKTVAERFGRYRAAVSHHDAMFGFFARAKSGKDYDGYGGYVVGARIAPDQCVVDLNHAALPFAGGVHGNEGEVIVFPDTNLVAKVYETFGNVALEVEGYMKKNKDHLTSPKDPDFFGYLGRLEIADITGDEDEGTVTFALPTDWVLPTGSTPKNMSANYSITEKLRVNLYFGEWVNDYTVHYKKMPLPGRVAARYLGV